MQQLEFFNKFPYMIKVTENKYKGYLDANNEAVEVCILKKLPKDSNACLQTAQFNGNGDKKESEYVVIDTHTFRIDLCIGSFFNQSKNLGADSISKRLKSITSIPVALQEIQSWLEEMFAKNIGFCKSSASGRVLTAAAPFSPSSSTEIKMLESAVKELETLGWQNVISFDAEFLSFQLNYRDSKNRDFVTQVRFSSSGIGSGDSLSGSSVLLQSDILEPVSICITNLNFNQNLGPGWLCRYYGFQTKVIEKNQSVLDLIDNIKSRCYVVKQPGSLKSKDFRQPLNPIQNHASGSDSDSSTRSLKKSRVSHSSGYKISNSSFVVEIALGELVSVEFSVAPKYNHEKPELVVERSSQSFSGYSTTNPPSAIKLHGPTEKIREYMARIKLNKTKWDSGRDFVENLQSLLGTTITRLSSSSVSRSKLKSKSKSKVGMGSGTKKSKKRRTHISSNENTDSDSDSNSNGDDVIEPSSDGFEPSNGGGASDIKVVCGVCFGYELNHRELPSEMCTNPQCKQPFHLSCLTKWLQSGNAKQNFRMLFGTCPYCQKGITVKI